MSRATEPAQEEAARAGRDHAADLLLALLMAEHARAQPDTSAFPDYAQSVADDSTRSDHPMVRRLLEVAGPAGEQAFREAFADRMETVVELARSILANYHRTGQIPKPGGKNRG